MALYQQPRASVSRVHVPRDALSCIFHIRYPFLYFYDQFGVNISPFCLLFPLPPFLFSFLFFPFCFLSFFQKNLLQFFKFIKFKTRGSKKKKKKKKKKNKNFTLFFLLFFFFFF